MKKAFNIILSIVVFPLQFLFWVYSNIEATWY